jgi:hypothetical protein
MEFWVARLNAVDAATAWPLACPLLEPAIRRGAGFYAAEDVADLVTRPEAGTPFGWSLWIIAREEQLLGAWTTSVRVFPRAKVLEIVFAGGLGMKAWYPTALSETEKFARETDCTRLTCAGRRGWARLGYRQLGYLHERVLS